MVEGYERPRPRPSAAPTPLDGQRRDEPRPQWTAPDRHSRRGRRPTGLARIEPAQPAQVVAAASNAIVTVARVGRLFGRSGWRIAKQLPGVADIEVQVQKLGHTAALELNRLLQMPQQVIGAATPEEQRVMMLVRDADSDPAPLRTAMSELLDRSTLSDGAQNREYLFGTIVSQLVPDEARMLAALATGRVFAAVDVVARVGGRSGKSHVVLSNASTLGAAAGVAVPQNTPTYLSRLHAFGLVEFGRPTENLDAEFDALRSDPAVRDARVEAEKGKQSSSKVSRKAVTLSALGREFWQACAPSAGSPSTPPGRRPY